VGEYKRISKEAVPQALALAERYRLLNQPEQAASICHDVLAVEPENAEALKTLFLATTEQFTMRRGPTVGDAHALVDRMATEYDRAYYGGIACERWARAKLQEGGHAKMVADWAHRAMERYEQAEALRPPGNDDAMLRWNACRRLLERLPASAAEEGITDYGD
jgi:hypothetical protein